MVNIFDYLDYREFLREHYREKKAQNPRYSYRYIARKTGFKSPSFFGQILKGQTNISSSMAARLAVFLKLSPRETNFFEALVNFCQAKNTADKNHAFRQLNMFAESKVRIVRNDQYEFYDKWYYSAISALLHIYPFNDDYESLANMLVPPIKASEAKEAVTLLHRLGFLRRNEDGRWVRLDQISDSSGYRAPHESIVNFQLQSLELARSALLQFPREARSISTVVFSLSRKGFQTIEEEMAGFRRKLLKIAEVDKQEDTIYQVNFQVFPLSKPIRGRKT